MNLFFCFLSSIVLILSYPKFDIQILAWVGLIPLFLVLHKAKSFKQSFAFAYVFGFLFYTGTLYWISFVTTIGMLLLMLYLALYAGLFGLGFYWLRTKKIWIRVIGISALWTVLEFLRGFVLTGFGWSALGYSQYKNLWVIQIADIVGVYGISFLIVLVNVSLALWFDKNISRLQKRVTNVLTGLLIAVVLVYGYVRTLQFSAEKFSDTIKLAVVQGNVEQEVKWQQTSWSGILKDYLTLSKSAAQAYPNLIIWPETSFPGMLWDDKESFELVTESAKKWETNFLVGAITSPSVDQYFNSALLISKNGDISGQYDKTHLVAFGEYIPFRFLWPWLGDMVGLVDMTSGREYRVLSLNTEKGEKRFSVLICFEDTIDRLVRKFVNNGAGLLINMTNDAWFYDTKEPFIHWQCAVLRAVENRRSMVRAANTGVSGFIAPNGRAIKYVQDSSKKKTFISGSAVSDVPLCYKKTIFTQWGNWWVGICFIFLGFIAANRKLRKMTLNYPSKKPRI